jgi:hypothetical protein
MPEFPDSFFSERVKLWHFPDATVELMMTVHWVKADIAVASVEI